MGNGLCCCPCGRDAATIDRERDAALPGEAYSDWAQRTRLDLGRDLTAVARDLPRMAVRVLPRAGTWPSPARASTTAPQPPPPSPPPPPTSTPPPSTPPPSPPPPAVDDSFDGTAAAAAERPARRARADDPVVLRGRLAHLEVVLTQLVAMVGDDDAAAALRRTVPAAWRDITAAPAARVNPDASVPLRELFRRTALLPEAAVAVQRLLEAGGAAAAEAAAAAGVVDADGAAAGDARRGEVLLAAVPPAFRLLLCFSQGVVFFAAQRVAFLLWMPWAARLRDQDWSVVAYDGDNPPPPGDGGSPLLPPLRSKPPRSRPHARRPSDEPLVTKAAATASKKAARPSSYGSTGDDDAPGVEGGKSGKPNDGGRGRGKSVGGRGKSAGGGKAAVNGETVNGEPAAAVAAAGDDDSAVLERCRGAGAPPLPAAAAPGHGVVCVAHTQTSRNFTDGDRHRPQFEVRWTMELVLDRRSGGVLAVHLQTPSVRCEAHRGLCGPSALYAARRRQLLGRAFSAFGIDVAAVERFSD